MNRKSVAFAVAYLFLALVAAAGVNSDVGESIEIDARRFEAAGGSAAAVSALPEVRSHLAEGRSDVEVRVHGVQKVVITYRKVATRTYYVYVDGELDHVLHLPPED